MAERLTPGVYVEEVSSGVKPIQGVGTSTAGFIGETLRGVPDRATFVRGFAEFEKAFGGHQRGAPGQLAQAVEAFFLAGGRRAYVVRLLPQDAATGVGDEVVMARQDQPWGRDRPVLRFEAIGRGAWSEHVRIHLEQSRAFRGRAFTVRVEWVEGGRTRTVEEFKDVVLDPESPDYVVEVISDRSRYVRVIDLFAEGLDSDPPSVLPIPMVPPRLVTRDVPSFTVALDTRWELRWSTPGPPPAEARREVRFTEQAVADSGGTTDGRWATLNPGQLRALLADQLAGDSFRVLLPPMPAAVESTPAPWDATTAGAAEVTVDGAAVAVPLAPLGPAALPPSAGDLALSAGDVLTLSVDGRPPQSYALAAGDVANDGQMTPAEAVTVLNREFTGVQAFLDDNGDLVLRSDSVGAGARLQVADDLATALGDPAPATGGQIADLTAVTAAELAASLNAALGAASAFTARVVGDRVRIEQTNLDNDHTVQWTGDAAYFADGTEHATAAGEAGGVAVEAPVATPAQAAFVLDPARSGELAGAFTLTASDADGQEPQAVGVAADAGRTTLAAFADAVNDALAGADLEDRIVASVVVDVPDGAERQTLLVRTTAPRAAGNQLQLSPDGGGAASPWADELPTLGGQAGMVVDDVALVQISVTQQLDPAIPSSVATVFERANASGYPVSSPANPDLLPALTELDPIRLVGGTDGEGFVGATEFRGSGGRPRTGLQAFDEVDIQILCMPGRNDDAVLAEGIGFVDARNIFLIADGPGSHDRDFQLATNDVVAYVEGLPSRTDNMAMFYPWLEVADPVGVGRDPRRLVPPSGHLAGVFARTDRQRGVWKAPAGLEATLPGALDLQQPLLDADQDLLNPIGLSCIRNRPGAGIVSWGSRTLSSDPEWRYVPVRRTALFLKESLLRGLQWVVFEPNDQELWQRIAGNITAFMLSLHRQGAFQGATAEEAFAVKCDRETNPQELVDQGIVTAQVAFAPLKPAEFVVVEISQKTLVAA
jgi:phage tail sheath protein FI